MFLIIIIVSFKQDSDHLWQKLVPLAVHLFLPHAIALLLRPKTIKHLYSNDPVYRHEFYWPIVHASRFINISRWERK